jgi:hypothetical protein
MKRILITLILSFLLLLHTFAASVLEEKLTQLKDVSQVEQLETSNYAEKYVVRFTQPIDHKHPEAGTFTQRVVINHKGFDRPTVIVTEGYGANYALSPRYQDELSLLLGTNVVVVEHRYFLESTPEPLNWDYLTAENSACDLHHVTTTLKPLYAGKWISTGISKGGQTVMIYRAFFPDDVDISVPYVAPLCQSREDGRHEVFLRKVGTKRERKQIKAFQTEALKRKDRMLPLLERFCREKQMSFRIPMAEVLDYCVLEYSFAFWQWGTLASAIPPLTSDDKVIFDHLMDIAGADYFADNSPTVSFFIQAAKELGYYGYDVKPFKKYLTIHTAAGYLEKIMLPESAGHIAFNDTLYHKVYNYLKDNDPQMIFIYGEVDPWSAVHAPKFKGKKNEHFYFQLRGSHRARISNMPERTKTEIIALLNSWLAE